MIAARIPAAARAIALPLMFLTGAGCGGSTDRATDSVVVADSAATPTVGAARSYTTAVASGG